MKSSDRNYSLFPCLFIISVIYVLLFSFSTSLLYPGLAFIGNDSSQFLTIGKAWYLGKIPYRDMFDHKGPFIFFIDLLGFSITGGRSHLGVALIQVIFLFFTLLAIYKITQLPGSNTKYGFLSILCTLILMRNNYAEGNSVEEYCLPFICWSSYFLLKDLYTGNDSHNYKLGFLYGITAGICFLTRITNFVSLTGFILVVAFINIRNKHYKVVIKTFLTFIMGAVFICAPFIMYFALNNSLDEMFFGTFTFNVAYASGMNSWLTSGVLKKYIWGLFYFYLSLLLLPTALLSVINKRYLCTAAYLITWAIEAIFFTQGETFVQYALICICHVPMFLNEMSYYKKIRPKAVLHRLLTVLFILSLIISGGFCAKVSIQRIHDNANISYAWDNLIGEIPNEDRDSFVMYGGNELKGSYLAFDIMPCYKYHIIQEWHASFSDFVRQDIRDNFESQKAKWILTDANISNIADIIDKYYELYDQNDGFYLYKKR